MADKEQKIEQGSKQESQEPKLSCGIIMPIASIDGCGTEHWLEIYSILKDIATEAGFDAKLVSESNESGIIQKRIVQNIYSSDIIICDVSCKNPNVMFELGMRLAFDKATIIIKDDITNYSFDTSPIEHLSYPRDLRFGKIIEFKSNLKNKLIATYKASQVPEYSTFLKSFGDFEIPKIQEKEVSSEKYLLNLVKELQSDIKSIKQDSDINSNSVITNRRNFALNRNLQRVNLEKFVQDQLEVLAKNSNESSSTTLSHQLYTQIRAEPQFVNLFESEMELLNYTLSRVGKFEQNK